MRKPLPWADAHAAHTQDFFNVALRELAGFGPVALQCGR